MPKVGSARGPNMDTSNLHTSRLSVPKAILKIYGASSTVGEPEPRAHMAMGGEQPRIPQMVSEMDRLLENQLYPADSYHLDG
jgi:hypothetical protein